MSEESNVNFVAGHAQEQTEAGDTQIPEGDRDAAIKAVKEALKAEGETAAKEAEEAHENDQYRPKVAKKAEADKQSAEAKTEEEAEVDTDTASLKQVLKQRQRLAQAKAKQSEEFAKERQEARQAWAQIQHAKTQLEAERAKLMALKSDPAKAVREAGWDPEEFIISLAKEGTDEGKMARLLRQQQEKLAEFDTWKQTQAQERQQQQEAAKMQHMTQYRQSIEQQFINHISQEEKFPHMNAFYKGRENSLIAEGDMVAAQYRNLTGKEASLEDIAEYIEESLAERANTWYENKSKSRQGNAPNVAGKSTKGAQGKTLTNAAASDRRSVASEIADLDGDERLAAAKDAVASALAASRAHTED